MKTRLTERDLNRIIRKVISEQETNTNFCGDADVDEELLNYHIEIIDEYKNMMEKINNMSFDCDLDRAMVFDMLSRPIFEKQQRLLRFRIKNIDVNEYVKHLKSKYNL
jgi:hypothetical protein